MLFLFLFGRLHWPSYIGNTNLLWVVNKSKAGFARRKEVHNFTTIGTIWCAVCALAKGGMFKVEYAKISIDQKLNHAWKCSNIKVTNRVSMSHPESRSDPIGGSESSSGCETQDWDSLPDFFFLKSRTGTCGYGPLLITESKYHIHIPSPIHLYKTTLLQLQIRAWNLHVVNPYKCVGPAECGCLLMSSPVPTRIKNPC